MRIPSSRSSDSTQYGWHDGNDAGEFAARGLSEEVVRNISKLKDEPDWMLQRRLKALKLFEKKPMPSWGADLTEIHFDDIKYFVRSTEGQATSWRTCPRTSATPMTSSASPRRRSSASSPVSPLSTSQRSSTTRSMKSSRSRASSSWTPTPVCVSTRRSSKSTSVRSFPPVTTSSQR